MNFTGQRIRWVKDQSKSCIEVSQPKAIDELEESPTERNTKKTPSVLQQCIQCAGTDKFVTELDTVSVLLQVLQMCLKGSFSNNWGCESTQQAGETAQVTAGETSVPADN